MSSQQTHQQCLCEPPVTHNVKFRFRVDKVLFSDATAAAAANEATRERVARGCADPVTIATDIIWHCVLTAFVEQSINITVCRNFIIIKLSPRAADTHLRKFVYTVFPGSGHINVSGVKDFAHIQSALDVFNQIFKTGATLADIKVDNSTSSGRLLCHCDDTCSSSNSRRLNLYLLKRFVDSDPASQAAGFYLSLRPHFFPGAVLRRRGQAAKKRASVILFANCKFVIVGAKSPEHIRETHRAVCALTRQCMTMSRGERPSAQSVGW